MERFPKHKGGMENLPPPPKFTIWVPLILATLLSALFLSGLALAGMV